MNTTRLALAAAFVLVFFAAYGLDPASGQPNGQAVPEGRFIVVFRDDLASAQAATAQAVGISRRSIKAEFRSAFKGFAAELTSEELTALRRNPAVAFIEPDLEVTIFEQLTPTGVNRIRTGFNNTANIDGVDDPMDVDIAIIDTGVDFDHPDLNVVFRVDCTISDPLNPADPCVENAGDDDNGHGTHVAGIAAARDNNIGVVGVAPGARIWSIKSLGSNGTGFVSHVLKGIEWVTARNQAAATEDQIIDVVNMSLGWIGHTDAGRLALQNSVAEGIVYVAAAGNDSVDVYGGDGLVGTNDDTQPASYPEVMTIAALNDSDGLPGGAGPLTGWGSSDRNGDGVADGVDDSFLWMSNFSNQVDVGNPVTSSGRAIDLILPGGDIYSTNRGGGYTTKSGTSMASPHAAGLAALYIVKNGRDVNGDTLVNEQDVYAIRQALIDSSVPQTGPFGLAVQNDPDINREGLGWADDSVLSPPTADAGGPYVADEGSAVVFDGSLSSDSDGSVVTYTWDFDYDGVTFDSQGNGANPQFIYTQDGAYTAALVVIDNDGLPSDINTASVAINNVGPTANAGGPYAVNLGNDVSLNATASSDPGQDITDYDWDLDNDGQYDDASGATVLFSPPTPGVMDIGLRVTDSGGANDTDSTTISVISTPAPTSIDVLPSSANLFTDDAQQFTANLLDQFGAPFTDEVSATTVSEDPSLVGSWKLDEGAGTVAGDSSSNGLDGTVNGGAQWIVGQSGSGLSFDGANDYVSVPYATDLQEWTVAAWVRSPNAPSSGSASGPVYRDQNFFLNWNHPAASFRGSAGLRVAGQWYSASFGPMSGNTWYHLVATYDGDTLRAYRDGVLVTANTTPSGPPDAENDALTIGRHSGGAQYFNGDVDEVLIYSRALTDQEISDLSTVSSSSFASGPSGLTASPSEQGVSLNWDSPDSIADVSSYRVYRAVTSGGEKSLIAQVPGALSDYVDISAIPGTTYFYEVTALDDNIALSSNEASAILDLPAAGLSEDPALVGNWKLDEGVGTVAGDSSSNGIDGTVNGGAQWIAGQAGSALSFDGSDDYVSIPFTTDLPQWTVAAWVRSPNAPASGPATGPIVRDMNFNINWDHPAAGFRGVATLRVANQWHTVSFGALSGNTWYHLAASYDGETLRAYRDGVLVASNSAPSGPPDTEDDPLTFGRHSGFANYFEGDVDEVYVFSRALTDQEVSNLSVTGPTDPTPPTAPTNLNANAVGQTIELTWNAANDPETGVSAYRIYRDTVGGGAKPLIAEISGALTSFTDTTTMPSTTYFYEVSALNGGVPPVEGSPSFEASDTTGDDVPAMPTGVTAIGGLGQISLDWDDNQESDLSHYNIYRSTGSGGPYSSPIGSVPVGTSAYVDGGLGSGETYYYVVTAVDLGGNSSPIAAQPVWDATGGTIDNMGLYTAGPASGDFTVTASVGNISGQADVTIVSPNQPPTAVDDAYNADEDQTLNVAAPGVLSNDSDPDLDPITAILVADVSNGTLALNLDGSFTYDPAPEYSGPDSFTYMARDTSGADSNVATVNITVNTVNDAPVAVNDAYSVDENASLVVAAPGVLANDSDIELDAFTAELVSDVSNGTLTLNPDGSFTYDPNPTYSGPDSFTYIARDTGGAASNIATVNITVNDLILGAIRFAAGVDTTINGLSVGKEDIVEFDGAAFSIYFDGSDVGLTGLTIDSVSIVSANEILLSFVEQANIAGIGTVDPMDVVRFNATSLGDTTSGTFELYFDGSAAGLIGNLIFAVD